MGLLGSAARIRRRRPLAATLLLLLLVAAAAGSASAQTAPRGIDVSHWQGEIDWIRVGGAGLNFAFAKATEGVTFSDATYPLNRSGAATVGMRFGAYHFARPVGASDAAVAASGIAQADYFLAFAQPHRGDVLPALDLEKSGGLSAAKLTAWTQAWLGEVVARLGVKPLVYVSPNFWKTAVGDTPLVAAAGHRLWIANWTKASLPILPGAGWGGLGWTFWQWTDCQHVAGILHCVDGDRFNGANLAAATVPTPPSGAPVSSSQPAIVGTPQAGQLLAAVPGGWAGGKPVTFAYEWERCDSSGAGCAPIAGAVKETYTPVAADVGHALAVSVTAQTAAATAVATSPSTLAVAGSGAPPATAPKPTTPPTIQGTPEAGRILSASVGTWSGTPTAFAFQWRRCAASGSGCVAIPGAGRKTYTLTPDDIGATLSLVVTATGRGGSRSATTTGTAVVAPAPVPTPSVGAAVAQPGQAGAVTTVDHSATATWQPGAVPAQATVSLASSASRLALPGTALTLTTTATAVLPWPIDVQYASAPADAVPGFLPGAGVWQPVAELTSPTLPAGQEIGAYRDATGALHLLTRASGRLALFAPGKWGDPRFASAARPTLTLLSKVATAKRPDGTVLVYGRITLDSQAHLYASVLAPGGGKALLLQTGSRLGWWLTGGATKTLQTLQLRPGAIPVRVRMSARQLRAGGRYVLRLAAVDPYGRRSQLAVPLTLAR